MRGREREGERERERAREGEREREGERLACAWNGVCVDGRTQMILKQKKKVDTNVTRQRQGQHTAHSTQHRVNSFA